MFGSTKTTMDGCWPFQNWQVPFLKNQYLLDVRFATSGQVVLSIFIWREARPLDVRFATSGRVVLSIFIWREARPLDDGFGAPRSMYKISLCFKLELK